MIGARHVSGSAISNGGDSSPIKLGHRRRRPWNPLLWTRIIRPEKRSFYVRGHCL
jgi:hypothetical protein